MAIAPDAGEPDGGADAIAQVPRRSIDDGDALLRRLGAGWSTNPLYAGWLQAAGLRQLVAAVQLVAEGNSPRAVLPFVALDGEFATREEGAPRAKSKSKSKPHSPAPAARTFIDPAAYARYDPIAEALGSVDAAAAGDAYARLEPFLDVAFSEIGKPGQRFHDVLTSAIHRVVSVKPVETEIELEPKGAVWAFKDPQLEALSGAEKQLLRMGPKNARVVQAQLRAFASHARLDVGG